MNMCLASMTGGVTLVVFVVGVFALTTTDVVQGQTSGAAPYRLVLLTQGMPPGTTGFSPMGVFIDGTDRLYVGDAQNREIWIVNASTLNVLETVEHECRGIHHLSAHPNGDIFAVSLMGGIRRFSRVR